MSKISFLLGAAVGYVLGARAGRDRYDQIRSGTSRIWRSGPVQDQVATAQHVAKDKAAPAARDALSSAAGAAGDKVKQGAERMTGGAHRDGADDLSVDGPETYPLGEG